MTLSEIKRALDDRGIRLTKSLGQNFLHDGNQLRRIVDAAGLGPSDRVLEIGPGLGPLTELLVAQVGHVLAIEKDARLVAFLNERFASEMSPGEQADPHLVLLNDDALEYVQDHREWGGWKLVANLPYSVASPILVELALAITPPENMVSTLQIEVAQRLVARAGDDDYGILTLLVQSVFEPRGWFKIPASCFYPPPEVDSACVRMVRRATPIIGSEHIDVFSRVVKRSFSQRRKMMFKLLRKDWPAEVLLPSFEKAGIAATERAERVSLEQFACLARNLAAARSL